MPRQPKIWLRGQTGWYCTTIAGVQHKLSKNKAEAQKAFHALMVAGAPPDRVRPPYHEIAEAFVENASARISAGGVASHRRYLQSFCDFVGGRRVPDLRGEHVTAWLKANPAWGPSTRCLAAQCLKASLNWALGEGLIAAHPLADLKVGSIGRRDRILTADEREKIRGRATGGFRDFFFALEQTGARPFSEIGRLEARFINWERRTAELPEHKNKHHGKRRILYFTPELMEVLRRLAAKHPEGPIFRSRQGNPWNRTAWTTWSKLIAKDTGVVGVTAYCVRHSYATDAIARGVPLGVLAELMGTSVPMLLSNYGHLDQKHDALAAAAAKAVAT